MRLFITGTPSNRPPLLSLLSSVSLVFTMSACATNPATGKRQLALIGEEQEIQMGREAAASVAQTIGLVDDKALQAYVAQIGQRAAEASERPNLPWEFHVVDDPTPNAFALPGGFIYITRGMLGLMTSEAELAGVLGHEIGHVTGRHSVNQLSKAQLAQLGMGLGSIFVPEMRPYQSLVGAGLELMFLKYSRDHEREADELGFEYMRKRGYDVGEFDDVFAALGRIGEQEGSGGALPSWLLTHPAPEERVESARARAAAAAPQTDARIGQEAYLEQIDDLVYGKDPRDGFFRGATFYHPKLRFQMTFPEGWNTENMTQVVVGVARDNRAALQLTVAGRGRPEAAIEQFFSQPGVSAGRVTRAQFNGQPAAIGEFQAQTEGGVVQGLAAYVTRGDITYQLIGYTAAPLYSTYGATLERAIRSFAPVTDPAILRVEPQRIDVVKIDASMTVAEFAERFQSAVPAQTLAIINQVPGPDSRLAAGTLVKRVVGRAS
jgi:predicted Zn-dependent protease